MRENHYYFTHDANAKDDPKCTNLIESLGLEGYGIFWVLVEILRGQTDYKYPLKLIPAIARKYNTTSDKINAVIYHYELFEIDENKFFSLSLNRRMYEYENKRLKQSEGGRIAMEKRWNDKLLISNLQDTYKQVITIKENNNKIKEDNILCSELENSISKPNDIIETFISKEKKEYYFTETDLKELKPVYPNVNIKQQILEMKQWLLSNPQRNKTYKGMKKFINGWLNREQDRQERISIYKQTPEQLQKSNLQKPTMKAVVRYMDGSTQDINTIKPKEEATYNPDAANLINEIANKFKFK